MLKMLCDCGKEAKRKVKGAGMCSDCLKDYDRIKEFEKREECLK